MSASERIEEMTVREAAINHRTETGLVTLWLPLIKDVQILAIRGVSRGVLAREQRYFRVIACNLETGKAVELSLMADSKIKAVWM